MFNFLKIKKDPREYMKEEKGTMLVCTQCLNHLAFYPDQEGIDLLLEHKCSVCGNSSFYLKGYVRWIS
jgi:hypothetical protein